MSWAISSITVGTSKVTFIISVGTSTSVSTSTITHYWDLSVELGDYTVSIDSGSISGTNTATYTLSWTPDEEEWAPYCTDAETGEFTAVLSYWYASVSYSITKTFKINLSSDLVPTLDSWSVSEANAAVAASVFAGTYMQSQSELLMEAQGTGIYGSTIADITFTVDGSSYSTDLDTDDDTSTGTATSSALTTYGTLTVKCTVTDTRGRTASDSTSITVVRYFKPVATIAYERDGTTVTITGTGAVANVSGKNTATITLAAYRASDETDYQEQEYSIGTITSSTETFTKSKSFTLEYLDTETYTLAVTVTDLVQSVTVTAASGQICFSLLAGGTGAAFGREAETEDLLDVAWDISSDGTITAASMAETSDRRLKQDIHRLRDTSLLDCLSPVSFRFLDNSETHYGFVAQDVPDANLVREDAKGYLTLDYIGIIPLLVGRVQELEARLRALEEEEDKA